MKYFILDTWLYFNISTLVLGLKIVFIFKTLTFFLKKKMEGFVFLALSNMLSPIEIIDL
jgi:hypothetical protein